MEMNTRIQVEHGVSELVSNVDIVKEQINVASVGKLSLTQENINLSGHAIECRILAEDPDTGFTPSIGTIDFLSFPTGMMGIRVDSYIYAGYKTKIFYDSLLAKIIVIAPTRKQAIQKARVALSGTVIDGIKTNIPLLLKILNDNEFDKGGYDNNSFHKMLNEYADSLK